MRQILVVKLKLRNTHNTKDWALQTPPISGVNVCASDGFTVPVLQASLTTITLESFVNTLPNS